MNKIILSGRLTKNPEVNYTSGGKVYTKFSLAVERPFAAKEKKVDFFDCTVFGKTAEMVGNNFCKGKRMLIEGHIQFDDYTDKAGNKRRSTQVMVERVYFIENRGNVAQNGSTEVPTGGFDSMGSDIIVDF
jgi:single-strand DNA-binding protein